MGALDAVLSAVRGLNINLSRIESRPSTGVDWDYDFFIDFSADEHTVATLLATIQPLVKQVRILRAAGEVAEGEHRPLFDATDRRRSARHTGTDPRRSARWGASQRAGRSSAMVPAQDHGSGRVRVQGDGVRRRPGRRLPAAAPVHHRAGAHLPAVRLPPPGQKPVLTAQLTGCRDQVGRADARRGQWVPPADHRVHQGRERNLVRQASATAVAPHVRYVLTTGRCDPSPGVHPRPRPGASSSTSSRRSSRRTRAASTNTSSHSWSRIAATRAIASRNWRTSPASCAVRVLGRPRQTRRGLERPLWRPTISTGCRSFATGRSGVTLVVIRVHRVPPTAGHGPAHLARLFE